MTDKILPKDSMNDDINHAPIETSAKMSSKTSSETSSEDKTKRKIRSFVRREGRLTPGQQKAMQDYWPALGIDFTEGQQNPTINIETLFDRTAPTTLEIGFGNGECLLSLAQTHPDENFIGIEVHRPGVGRILRRINELDLSNVRISQHDAIEVLQQQIPDTSLQRVLLFFADPWHKKRHNKRRIVKASFAQLVAQKLKPGGILHMATDWQDYAEWMVDVMREQAQFKNCAHSNVDIDGDFVPRPATRPVTHFEKRGEKLGHGIWDLVYEKID